MPLPVDQVELAAFARRVRGNGRGVRRIVVVGGDGAAAEALTADGFVVERVPELIPGTLAEHAYDGLWLGSEFATAMPDLLRPLLADAFRILHHGFVRLPVGTDDPCRRLALELLLERAHFQIVEPDAGLIGWTKLVPPLLAAGGVVVDDRGRVLLSDRADGLGWCIPGGIADPDEAPEATAVREIHEEVGVAVEIDRLLGIYSVPSRFTLGKIVVVQFLCRQVGGTPSTSDEVVDVGWFHEHELPERLMPRHRVRLRDAFAVIRGEASPPFIHDES